MMRSQRHSTTKALSAEDGASDRAAVGMAVLLGLPALILGQAALGRILLLISP